MNKTKNKTLHCGYVAIIGKPNVGKSTLLNNLIGEKISITSNKPQTTRHRILGIDTQDNYQTIYVDTPGIHMTMQHQLNKLLNRSAQSVIKDVDVVLFMIEALRFTAEEQHILEKLAKFNGPIILLVNKVDKVKDKNELLPFLQQISEVHAFTDIIPICAKHGENVDKLKQIVIRLLPTGDHLFPDDQITDRDQRFLIAEIIREKLFRGLGQELPYAMAIEIESIQKKDKVTAISAIIWLSKTSQKAIVIGKQGEKIKSVGIQARRDIEKSIGHQVHLNLWVKVKKNWMDDKQSLQQFGFDE